MSDYPLYYLIGCMIISSIGCMILGGLAYTPADFDYLAVNDGEIVGDL
jgi:hypothetical protein